MILNGYMFHLCTYEMCSPTNPVVWDVTTELISIKIGFIDVLHLKVCCSIEIYQSDVNHEAYMHALTPTLKVLLRIILWPFSLHNNPVENSFAVK